MKNKSAELISYWFPILCVVFGLLTRSGLAIATGVIIFAGRLLVLEVEDYIDDKWRRF